MNTPPRFHLILILVQRGLERLTLRQLALLAALELGLAVKDYYVLWLAPIGAAGTGILILVFLHRMHRD